LKGLVIEPALSVFVGLIATTENHCRYKQKEQIDKIMEYSRE
jgi:hypothetical protein